MHIYQKPNGSWCAVVQYQAQRRKVTRNTRAAAMKAGAEALIEMGGTPTADPTVDELIDAWLEEKTLAPTYRADAERIRGQLPTPFRRRTLSTVGPLVVKQLFAQMGRDGRSVHRIRRAHEVLSSAFHLAEGWQWVDRNPFGAVSKPAAPDRAETLPSRAQVRSLLADRGHRLWLFVNVAATTSARRGDVVALRWTDIDLDDESIRFHRALAYAPGVGVHEKTGKAGKQADRRVAIDPALCFELAEHQVAQAAQAVAKGQPAPEWVFSHDLGITPWTPDFASKEWARWRATHGLPATVRLHDLRHFIISEQLAAGVAPKVAGGRAGHTQTRTTTDRYGHRIPAADRAAAVTVASILGRGHSEKV